MSGKLWFVMRLRLIELTLLTGFTFAGVAVAQERAPVAPLLVVPDVTPTVTAAVEPPLSTVENRRATIALCLPLIAVLALGSGPLLGLLSVPVTQGLPVLLILLAGQLTYCLFPSRDLLLAMAGEERVLRRNSLWQLAFCIALCFALTPPFGAVGAALASGMIWIGGALAIASAARRKLPQLDL